MITNRLSDVLNRGVAMSYIRIYDRKCSLEHAISGGMPAATVNAPQSEDAPESAVRSRYDVGDDPSVSRLPEPVRHAHNGADLRFIFKVVGQACLPSQAGPQEAQAGCCDADSISTFLNPQPPEFADHQ